MIAHGKEVKIICGNADPEFARAVANRLYLELGKAEVKTFADGEVALNIGETVRGADVFIIQSTCKPVNDNLMQLLVMIDACRRASAGRITAVMPYYGYARQDRKAKSRDPITAKLVANLITAAGADRVLTMDLHADQIQGFFDIPCDNLRGQALFAKYYQKKFTRDELDEMVIVSPDVGSAKRCRNFMHSMSMNYQAIVDKNREKANVSEVMHIIGDVKDKDVIILDDIVDTAGSLCNAAKALKEIGGARRIYACATHGVLSGPAIQRLKDSCIEEMVFLNTIPLSEEAKAVDKIKQISACELFAEAIRRTYEEIAISTLF